VSHANPESDTVTITAAILHDRTQPLALEQIELQRPKAGEVRVRMIAAGVCRSDLSVMDGTWEESLPIVLGHEGAGVVVEVGAGVSAPKVGDRVAFSWVTGCGRCRHCASGRPALCEVESHHGTLPDGTSRMSWKGEPVNHWLAVSCFAEEVVVPATQAITISPDADPQVAALVGCAAMTGIGAAINTASVSQGASAVVFGCGGVGLCILQGLRLAGATPILAVDVSDAALELAREAGATHTLKAGPDIVEQIKELTGGGVEWAFEALGRQQTIEQSFQVLERGGRAVIVGAPPYEAPITINASDLVDSERALMGSLYGSSRPHLDAPRLLALEAAGRIDLASLITRRYPFAQINDALADLTKGLPGRGVVTFG
jgi:S-(hydroxymethyl)glutathione dehydrogenase / alcohol dehydrogenase